MAAPYKPAQTGGDDLDDGLELDPDLVASDDDVEADGDGGASDGSGSGSEGEGSAGAFLSDDDEAPGPGSGSRKRKAGADEDEGEGGDGGGAGGAGAKDVKAERKRRRKEKERARKAKRLEREQQASADPAHMAPAELAAALLRSIRESFPAAAAMEIDDVAIPTDRLLPALPIPAASDAAGPSDPLAARLADLFPKPRKLQPATPRVIVLCISGVRCADVVRAARDVKTGGEVAKLFAKHFKAADQAKYLSATKVGVAVGTPGRVATLLEQGAIKVTKDTVVLLDLGHRDGKNRTLLNMYDVRDELWRKVFSGHARVALLGAGARVGAF
ncbi:Protein cms1 [Cryptotrichosporon argae]